VKNSKTINAHEIHIRGLVQGVGFRPFVYRQAMNHRISGWVENNNTGIHIHAEGMKADLEAFLQSVRKNAPRASLISRVGVLEAAVHGFTSFAIKKSEDLSGEITDVSPDIAVCDECLDDMQKQDHRINYPFINCTNCGPRFTIIRGLPYDRPLTTMAPFVMCEKCRKEYTNVLDRRFHAQPVACNHCGPHYALHVPGIIEEETEEVLRKTAALLDRGGIVAMKGLGGFHLACDALNDQAVDRLRQAKNRDGKPFAVMFRDMESAGRYARLGEAERQILGSWQRPIVLMEKKEETAAGVSVGFNTIGGMLPYMPFHHLLFSHLHTDVIVLTSGNISDEPIIISNTEAMERLSPLADAVVLNNRDIHNRTDDSVVRVINQVPRLIRRSRSWVPRPVNTGPDVDGIFACGAELVNCFCIGKGRQAIISQHIGDLKNAETLEFYSESAERFGKLFRFEPRLMVHDLHPDYLSSRYAQESGLPSLAVQHHHAHIVSCMAEHSLDEKVIGVSFDGVGLGTDMQIWGGEFMLCDLRDFERAMHLRYVPMPGGDTATKEPWRMAVSFLIDAFGNDYHALPLPFLSTIDPSSLRIVEQAIALKINTPFTSSAGRLFDAVSALSGLCSSSSFHAEAPMRLESIADPAEAAAYDFITDQSIDTRPLIRGVCRDILEGVPAPLISARFHNTVINIIFAGVSRMSRATDIRKVVFSGGTFQNKYLLEGIENRLRGSGYSVFSPAAIPANDGGIALGQLLIAAARRSKH
jgi:hydrogenase maturation protein HypF